MLGQAMFINRANNCDNTLMDGGTKEEVNEAHKIYTKYNVILFDSIWMCGMLWCRNFTERTEQFIRAE